MRTSYKFNLSQLPQKKSFDKKNLFDRKTEEKSAVFTKEISEEELQQIKFQVRKNNKNQLYVFGFVCFLVVAVLVRLGYMYLD